MSAKTPTASEINQAAAEFWKAETNNLERLGKEHPELVKSAAELASKAVKSGHIADPEWAKETSIVGALPRIDTLHKQAESSIQSTRAQKPRPKKRATHRSEVIAAMRKVRTVQTLTDFVDAAAVGSIEKVSIIRHKVCGVERFTIDCDAVDAEKKKVSGKTLSDWWAEAAKK